MDSYPGIRDSFVTALETHGVEVPDEQRVRQIPGPPMWETLTDLGLEGQLHDDVFATYLEHQENGGWNNATPFPGMKDLLAKWQDEGIILSTATSKSEVSAKRILTEHDMLKYFTVLGAAQENGTRRSKAAVIEYALTQLKEDPEIREILNAMDPNEALKALEPTHMLLIGDRIHDVEGAAQAGIPSVLVGWGYGSDEERAKAAYTVDTPEELDALVQRWANEG